MSGGAEKDTAIEALKKYGANIEPDPREQGAWKVTFAFGEGVTTIRILLNDYSGADLVITNITTLPESQTGQGYGSKAIQQLLLWAKENDFNDIRAVQVQEPSEGFWLKNGFAKDKEPNGCNDFVYQSHHST